MKLKNVTLELSSKPFKDESEETLYCVCNTMFAQWQNLTKHADVISILLWLADGSEILEYSGDLNQPFEWAYWIGIANSGPKEPNLTERQKRNTHKVPKKYIPNPGVKTYAWTKRLIEVLREVGAKYTAKPIRIGAIFDNGPEFAVSDFKYNRHKEIAQGHTMYPNSFVVCNSTLNADSRKYAAFPNGIEQDTTLGHFLGRQFKVFAKDLGYDYIWLSNGMGFGKETWGVTGALFDKNRFYPEKVNDATATMLKFWEDFINANPDVAIETRGSNFSAGTEISSDGCPIQELYYKYKIAPPVNSPWAALNFNSGLELTAWMSHVAVLPDERFPFRYYIHDPWFLNSPWLDRYGREPWDIYQPLSISRIDENGKINTPNSISLLTVDDTNGNMPEQVPNEVIPHLLDAVNTAPDQAGPLVWVYPFDEYSNLVRGDVFRGDEVFNEELFIGEAVQEGFPLNTVISTNNFKCLDNFDYLSGAILVVPVCAVSKEVFGRVEAYTKQGGKVIFYGTMKNAIPELCEFLQISIAPSLTGEGEVNYVGNADEYKNSDVTKTLHILPQFDGGGACEIATANSSFTVCATFKSEEQERLLSIYKPLENGGAIGFVRSLLACNPDVEGGRHFARWDSLKSYPAERLMRYMSNKMKWSFIGKAFEPTTVLPRPNIARYDNGFVFSIFAINTAVELQISTPLGAPIFLELDNELSTNSTILHPPKSFRNECRCFVKQNINGVITSKIGWGAYPEYYMSQTYSGFENAEVRFFPPAGFEDSFEVTQNICGGIGDKVNKEPLPLEWEDSPLGRCVVFKSITGNLHFAW